MRLLAEISLMGERLVPWSAPRTFQGGKPGGKRHWVHEKNQKLIAWQDSLRAAHRKAYGKEPYRGPVMLMLTFIRQTENASLWGKRWWREVSSAGNPDWTNLAKGAEDALTTRKSTMRGTLLYEIPGVFANDSQTCDTFVRKRWGSEDGVEIKVYALEEDET